VGKRVLDRPATAEEIAIVRWLLENVPVRDVSEYRRQSLDELHVVGGCECGCISVDFQPDAWGGSQILADGVVTYEDGIKAGLILWGKNGKIVLLEAYDLHTDSSHRMPTPADLLRWEQLPESEST
jgi:hypothetical protein